MSMEGELWHIVEARRDDGTPTMFRIRELEPIEHLDTIFVVEMPYPITEMSRLPSASAYRRLAELDDHWLRPACTELGWELVGSKTEDGSFFLYMYGAGDPNELIARLSPFDANLGFYDDRDPHWQEYGTLRELLEQAKAIPQPEHALGVDPVADPIADPVADLVPEPVDATTARHASMMTQALRKSGSPDELERDDTAATPKRSANKSAAAKKSTANRPPAKKPAAKKPAAKKPAAKKPPAKKPPAKKPPAKKPPAKKPPANKPAAAKKSGSRTASGGKAPPRPGAARIAGVRKSAPSNRSARPARRR